MAAGGTILWLRSDLRLDDNPALDFAAARGAVTPIYIWCVDEEGDWAPGAASRWWLHGSLQALDSSLRAIGSRLVVRRGPALDVLRSVAAECGADAVAWNRRYEPAAVARDKHIKAALREDGLGCESFNGSLLFEPWENTKRDGTPYRVFTPFWKAMLRRAGSAAALEAPARLAAPAKWPRSDTIESLELLPRADWSGGMREAWTPGEAGARASLQTFVDARIDAYPKLRDEPGSAGTSRLSPRLHFGEISVRRAWNIVKDAAASQHAAGFDRAAESWLRQLGWREFGHHLLFHFPHTPDAPLNPRFAGMPWRDDRAALHAWQRGRTGYPLVDAGLRELWATGWMHNRVRMIVASFLVKDLRIAWQEGARWFWDTLVDADLANNTMGWQWVAGCGADAAPYFRVFNPTLQSRRYDPRGEYLRRWLPELARLDDKWIHEPFAAPPLVLESAGIRLGRDYPEPIVHHDAAKRMALEAYDAMVGRRRD